MQANKNFSGGKIDQRINPRLPITLDAHVYNEASKLGHFKTKNIGYQGVFIETIPKIVDLCLNDLVEVVILVKPVKRIHYKISGMVAHHSAYGIGIVFNTNHAFLLRILEEHLNIVSPHAEPSPRIRNAVFID